MAISYARQVTFSAFLLQDILNPNDSLIKLASVIDWESIHERLRPYYSTVGRQGLPIRLMVGLHLLKHREGMSDSQVSERIRGDLYWMYFCGVDPESLCGIYRHLDSSSMTKFRNRIGEKGFHIVEDVIRRYLIEAGHIDPRMMSTDSACLEKHIYYPTDSNLLDRGRKKLIGAMKKLEALGVKKVKGLRTFVRRSQQIVISMAKFGKDRKERQERIKRGTLELAKQASHVVRRSKQMLGGVGKAIKNAPAHQQVRKLKRAAFELAQLGEIVTRVIRQARARFRGRHLPNKVYSLHEPEVICIKKGKRRSPNEYGMKFNLSVDKRGFIVCHEEQTKVVHDTKCLEPAIKHWERVTGKLPDQLNGDRGYRQKKGRETLRVRKIRRLCIPTLGRHKHPDHNKAWFKRGHRLRAHLEGTIGHVKSRGKCRYRGNRGSKIHLTLNCVNWNLMRLARTVP